VDIIIRLQSEAVSLVLTVSRLVGIPFQRAVSVTRFPRGILSTALPTPCDRGHAESVEGKSVRNPGWTLAATMLASSLAFIDGSVVNVALPAIGGDLHAMPQAYPGQSTPTFCRYRHCCCSAAPQAIIMVVGR
jgi:hypothetical protein